ncbi:MAG: hypothetical protein H5U29_14155, partial [Pusillimonas sp.]|nr:hypothetical protein [Pusillimonas sp.]
MSDTFIIAASIFASVYLLAIMVYMAFRQNLRLKERQLELDARVRMDDFRAHLERDIMKLNSNFSQSESRFDELNHMVISGQSNISELSKSEPSQSAFLRAHGITLATASVKPHS